MFQRRQQEIQCIKPLRRLQQLTMMQALTMYSMDKIFFFNKKIKKKKKHKENASVFDLRRMLNPDSDDENAGGMRMEVSEDGTNYSPVHLLPPVLRSCRAIQLEVDRMNRNFRSHLSRNDESAANAPKPDTNPSHDAKTETENDDDDDDDDDDQDNANSNAEVQVQVIGQIMETSVDSSTADWQ
ncbi:hypothetical protein RFI_30600, partial [Reticulomyxa filosa]